MYSCHRILECCGLFSGVKLSIRSFVLFLDTSAVILRKKSEIVGENFFPALKMQFGRFY